MSYDMMLTSREAFASGIFHAMMMQKQIIILITLGTFPRSFGQKRPVVHPLGDFFFIRVGKIPLRLSAVTKTFLVTHGFCHQR